MRPARIFGRGPESRLLPITRLHRPTVVVLAAMTFAMVVIAAAGLALSNAAGRVSSGVEGRFVMVVPAAIAPELPKAVAAARSVRGVAAVTPVPQSEMRKSLSRWIGDSASGDLPVPAMAVIALAPGADPVAAEKALQAKVPQAEFSAEAAELGPMLAALHTLQWTALLLVLLIGSATGAAIVLAARGALDMHRSTVEIMHGIGATDAQLTRLFQRKIAEDALAGALSGAIAAALLLLIAGSALAATSADLAGSAPLGPLDFLLLALVPLASVAIAIAVARWTLLRALRETL